MNIIFFKIILILILFNNNLFASYSISGIIRSSDDNETIIGANLSLESTKKGATTDKNGYYIINGVESGTYKLEITYIGYKKFIQEIKISDNLRLDIKLDPSSVMSDEIVVRSERDNDKRNITISKVDIPMSQLKEIRIGGESDVFRALQYLPGVLTSSRVSNGLYIRGGSPDQNLILVDGATVYNPSHLFGFLSTFNADAIKDVELIKGGFNAEYGGRLSSVVNLTQRDGNGEEYKGMFNVGVLSSKLAVEGPLGNGSFYLGGRRTYFELVKKAFTPKPGQPPIPDYNFYDINAKVVQNISKNDKISFTGFFTKDNLSINQFGLDLNLGLGNNAGSIKWDHIFKKDMVSTGIISYSEYDNNLFGNISGNDFLTNNKITDYSAKYDLEWFTSDRWTNKFGVELKQIEFLYRQDFTGNSDERIPDSLNNFPNFSISDIHSAVYAQSNYNLTDLIYIQGGLRLSHWRFINQFNLDPRLAALWQVQENIKLKFAWGIYHQNLKLATQPDLAVFDTWLGTDTTLNVAKSNHYIFSVETKPFEGYDLNFDIYYKTLENINELNRFATQIKTGSDALYEGIGEAYGFEIFLQKKYGKLGGWIGYGLGVINAQFDSVNTGNWFNPRYDRRHDFKIVLQYTINENWNVGTNFTYQTGQPFTQQTARGQAFLPGDEVGRGKTVPAPRFNLRLPDSHFLNINAKWSFEIFKLPSSLIFDIYNVYNRRDFWFRQYRTVEDVTTIQDVRLLPIIPSISWELQF